jgi:3-oxoadipate enol-lactonase/4-carboxymuconolactone decarboxylase
LSIAATREAGAAATYARTGAVRTPAERQIARTAHIPRDQRSTEMTDPKHEQGAKVRREVLGDDYVNHTDETESAFTSEFQHLSTLYAWGEIWARPGLDRKTRSAVTLTALTAGGYHDKLALHVSAAIRNGMTKDEIKEVLLQTSVYCGFPAANDAFLIAQRALEDNS